MARSGLTRCQSAAEAEQKLRLQNGPSVDRDRNRIVQVLAAETPREWDLVCAALNLQALWRRAVA